LTCRPCLLCSHTGPETVCSGMVDATRGDVTQILLGLHAGKVGDDTAANRIFELTYDELRRLAAGLLKKERADITLQPTALVHEAYCRLVDQSRVGWQNRAHFFGIAARAMRRILVDHARRRARAKRGGGRRQVTLIDAMGVAPGPEIEILDLHEALTRLATLDERMERVVELRVFVGMTAKEAAHLLGVSRGTVQEDWRFAKMWLRRELAEGVPGAI
jgi:RNA polymerase sigma-70 factor (ECF subfamily)